MLTALNTWLLHILPQHALTWCMRQLTRCQWPWLKNFLIGRFIPLFKVDMDDAVETDYRRYRHFDDFFTRALRPQARPLAEADDAVICPVDGRISQCGPIVDGRLLQAKGIDYSLATLLAGSTDLADLFAGGSFCTLYLSPRDYHRIHMPVSGQLTAMHYIPGRLFSVNGHSTDHVRGLFTRNERLVTLFETEQGPLAMVLVGAMFVSGIDTVWAGMISNGRQGPVVSSWDYRQHTPAIRLERGQEMGRFHMGSTVILIFPRDAVTLATGKQAGGSVRMGELLGQLGTDH